MKNALTNDPGSIVELNDSEISAVSGGDGETMWVREVWIEGGEEVWVVVEYERDGNRWGATGNWKYMSQEEVDKIMGGGSGGQT